MGSSLTVLCQDHTPKGATAELLDLSMRSLMLLLGGGGKQE